MIGTRSVSLHVRRATIDTSRSARPSFAAVTQRMGSTRRDASARRREPAHAAALHRGASAAGATPRRWTLVQGVLAPLQFLVFLVSLALVLRYLATGDGLAAATVSVVVKTLALYAIMVTGCDLGEGRVRPLPVRAGLLLGRRGQHAGAGAAHRLPGRAAHRRRSTPRGQMLLALAAYATYVVNATQFLLKLRAARLRARRPVRRAARSWSARHDAPSSRAAAPPAAATRRSCASAASARCSAA